jgi:hypothetical protein
MSHFEAGAVARDVFSAGRPQMALPHYYKRVEPPERQKNLFFTVILTTSARKKLKKHHHLLSFCLRIEQIRHFLPSSSSEKTSFSRGKSSMPTMHLSYSWVWRRIMRTS